MKDLVHAAEVYAEGNFRVAMLALSPYAKEQVPHLKYIGELLEAKRDWLRTHTDLDIHPDEVCFAVHTLKWVRLEDGRKYHVSYLFLSRKGAMTPENWDDLLNKTDIRAYRDNKNDKHISLKVFPEPALEDDQPIFQHADGEEPVLIVRVRGSLRYVVGANSWRIKLLNSVSTTPMKAKYKPLMMRVEVSKDDAPTE
jgi:hypothetical protein